MRLAPALLFVTGMELLVDATSPRTVSAGRRNHDLNNVLFALSALVELAKDQRLDVVELRALFDEVEHMVKRGCAIANRSIDL